MMLSALILAAVVAPPLPARLSVSVKPDQLTVGDRTQVTLHLSVPAGQLAGHPRFPVWKQSWGDARVLKVGPVRETSGRNGDKLFQQSVTLVAFSTGKVPLPPRPVAVPLRAKTVKMSTPDELALHVRSVLPEEKAGKEKLVPKAPAPPRSLTLGAAFWWTAGFASLMTLAGLILLYRRRRKSGEPGSSQPPLPPLVELEAKLGEAGRESDLDRLHTAISLALRTYLGRVLPFAACDRTTREIQKELRDRHLPEAWIRSCVRLLLDCDQVKFARQQTGRKIAEGRLARALEIARDLELHLRPEAAKIEKIA